MKHGKNPTVKQRKQIQAARLDSDDWLVAKVFSDRLILVHRHAGHLREIETGR